MPYRKTTLANEGIYHIYNKSIAGFTIFNYPSDFERILKAITFYTIEKPPQKLSLYLRKYPHSDPASVLGMINEGRHKIVRIIAYCIMPTHIHLLLQQLRDNGISKFANLVLKSYTAYFNEKLKRKGPLWESRFKNVLIKTEEHFLHLTRYIHLNPVTANLVNDPKDWNYSSYREYLGLIDKNKCVCDFLDYLQMHIPEYEKFVKDGIDYERNLHKIKHLALD